uniref:NB-ARC domain-containing protein n=1 Tax=Fagus sylvatica TaxID=28930 RepID=A0A2N9IXF9_FAGSY
MGIVGLIVTWIVLIATAVNNKIVESIGQWLIKNMVEPFGQLLFEKLVKPIGQWLGVGKSTLVREVAKKVKEERLFDEVAIAIVKQNPDQRRIQGEIADKLDLDLKLAKETLSGRADLLRERLTQDKNKKILVILDDIWEKLDLDEIGIPRQGCKVVVTSRDRDILSSQMDTEKDFGLYVLPKEEAWSLFEKFSGDSLKDSNLRSKSNRDQCVLEDISLVGELKNLEILSLAVSEFKQLPREIGLLTRLRMLDLSNCTKLEVIPPNVLSRLIRLEELYVGNSFTQWEVEGLNNERASLAELKHLSQLTTLEVHIPDANILAKRSDF